VVLGNITNKSDVGNYQYTNNNPYQATNIAGVTGTYDANGNLTHAYTSTMVYDFNDRMTKVTVGSTVADYYYDHSKTRIAKYNPATGAFKLYPNQYYEYLSTGTKDRYLFLGNQRLGVTERVGTSTPELFLNFSDHLNSSSVTTDSQGNVTNLIDYYPYGTDRVNVKVSSFSPTYKFTDQENDPESGLMYYDARYYNPTIGKFTQADLAAFYMPKINDPQQLNYYSYGRNNPIRYQDPTGNTIIETNDQGRIMMTIESGDTLSQIAKGFNISYQTLADQLGIKDPNKINVGDAYDITNVTDGNGVNIIGLGSVFIDLEGNYSVRVDSPRAGITDKFNAHLYKNGKQLKEYSQDMYGNAREGKKSFGDKINKQLEDNKKWNQKRELQDRWDRDHKNDRNDKSGSLGSSSGNQGVAPGVNPNTLFFLPVPFVAPMPSFIFGPIFTPVPSLLIL